MALILKSAPQFCIIMRCAVFWRQVCSWEDLEGCGDNHLNIEFISPLSSKPNKSLGDNTDKQHSQPNLALERATNYTELGLWVIDSRLIAICFIAMDIKQAADIESTRASLNSHNMSILQVSSPPHESKLMSPNTFSIGLNMSNRQQFPGMEQSYKVFNLACLIRQISHCSQGPAIPFSFADAQSIGPKCSSLCLSKAFHPPGRTGSLTTTLWSNYWTCKGLRHTHQGDEGTTGWPYTECHQSLLRCIGCTKCT